MMPSAVGMRRASTLFGCVVATVGLAACGSSGSGSNSSSSNSSSSGTSASAASSTGAASSTTVQQSTIALAARYAGAKTGAANPKLAPLVVGFADEEGSSPSFAEMDHAATASVQFINQHLDGVDGHPLKLDKCVIQAVQDGQKCAAQFINAHVKVANVGLTVLGNQALYSAIGGKFPVIVSGEGGGADITTPDVYLLDGGGAAMIGNMAQVAKSLGAKSLAVIASSNPAGKYAVEDLMIPAMKQLGETYKVIYVSDTGTTPDYTSALQAAGASSEDMIAVIPANVSGCVSSFDGLRQLGITKKVVATYTCYGSPWPQTAGAGADKWYFSGFTFNPHLSDNADAAAWRNVMASYGQSSWTYTGVASKELQDLLLLTKFGDELGFNNITPAALKKKITSYDGPGFMVPGKIDCSAAPKATPGVCGTGVTASTFSNGHFVTFTG
jgi:branched-chain amino acid transport system substrate-binding protein